MGINASTEKQLLEYAEFSETIAEVCYGAKRNTVRWTPKVKHVKGILLICHRLHGHSLRYFKVANALTSKGFIVASIDHKGHGLSDGKIGLIDDWTVLIKDFHRHSYSLAAHWYLDQHLSVLLVRRIA